MKVKSQVETFRDSSPGGLIHGAGRHVVLISRFQDE